MMDPAKVNIRTIDDWPTVYPAGFIARLFRDFKPSDTTMTGPTLEAVRVTIQHVTPYDLAYCGRNDDDEPEIIACWL